jgi:hypothetical protein
MTPTSNPEANDAANANKSAVESIEISPARGKLDGAIASKTASPA